MYQKIFFLWLSFLAICLMPSCQSWKDLSDYTPYEDMAITFTESKLKQIFKLEAINLKSDSIYLEKVCQYSDLQKIFSEKILRKFTAEGHAEVHNLKVHTRASWRYYPDTKIVLIYFKRIKKTILKNY